MRTVQFALHVGKEQVSAELNIPEGERLEGNLVIILAHGLNEMGMHHPVIEVLHDQLPLLFQVVGSKHKFLWDFHYMLGIEP